MPPADQQSHHRDVRAWSATDPRATVVVLHGLGEHAGLYERFAAELNEHGISVLVPDAPGHGRSGGPRGVIDDLAAWLDDIEDVVVQAAEAGPVSLVGHELGGLAAALVAARSPGLLRSLILSSPWISVTGVREWLGPLDDEVRASIKPPPRSCASDPWFLDRYMNDPEVWVGGFSLETLGVMEEGCAQLDASLDRLDLPVLVLRGEFDEKSPLGLLEGWVARLPQATLWSPPGARHAVLNDRPHREVAARVAAFVLSPAVPPPPEPVTAGRPGERPPDIILIMTDQQRWDWLGHTSDGHFETPNLDALAESGVSFVEAYSAATVCVPARTALLTGFHHAHVGLQDGGRAMRPGVWTVARELQAAGYETALIGRMHFEPMHADHGFETMRMCENINLGSGYDEAEEDDYRRWLADRGEPDWRLLHRYEDGMIGPYHSHVPRVFPAGADHHSTGWIEREATAFLRSRSDDRPLFLVVSFPHPHAPYDPPEPYASMYAPEESIVPEEDAAVNDVLTGELRAQLDLAEVQRVGGDHDHVRRVLAAIRGLVRHIDDAVGSILAELDVGSSLVVFTSDHGDYGGHRGLLAKTPWVPFEDLIRVPMIVAGGAVAGPPRRSSAPVQNASFVATCLDYAGVAVPWTSFAFPSLRDYLDGDEEAIDAGHARIAFFNPMVRRGRYKLITDGELKEPLLFDLEVDPGETRSVADDPAHAELVEELTFLLAIQRGRLVPAEVQAARGAP